MGKLLLGAGVVEVPLGEVQVMLPVSPDGARVSVHSDCAEAGCPAAKTRQATSRLVIHQTAGSGQQREAGNSGKRATAGT